MVLLVDIGNSNIVFGFSDKKTISNTFRLKTFTDKTSDEYYLLICNLHLLILRQLMHLLHQNEAIKAIKNFELIPTVHPDAIDNDNYPLKKEWHMLGDAYQYLSTPLNTEELSLETSLPRKDVPGLRFVRSSSFASSPACRSAIHFE